jgi:hypothetical protein
MIPQSFVSARPHNVISGAFTATGRRDWAALCSSRGASAILVFRLDVEQPVAELARQSDRSFLQAVSAAGAVRYSRVLRTVGSAGVQPSRPTFGGERPPLADHQGIEDSFAEKASVVRYYDKGRWLELQGAD